MRSGQLFDPKQTNKQWNQVFEKSYAVHFYNGSKMLGGKSQIKILSANHYGAKKPAYLVLAHQFCPIAYHSVQEF